MATTIDEDKIIENIADMQSYASRLEVHAQNMHRTAALLGDIIKVNGMDNTLVNPPDKGTGAQMTDARRLEIYTGCIAEADRLLGTTIS